MECQIVVRLPKPDWMLRTETKMWRRQRGIFSIWRSPNLMKRAMTIEVWVSRGQCGHMTNEWAASDKQQFCWQNHCGLSLWRSSPNQQNPLICWWEERSSSMNVLVPCLLSKLPGSFRTGWINDLWWPELEYPPSAPNDFKKKFYFAPLFGG